MIRTVSLYHCCIVELFADFFSYFVHNLGKTVLYINLTATYSRSTRSSDINLERGPISMIELYLNAMTL